jgi:hypothetical protein
MRIENRIKNLKNKYLKTIAYLLHVPHVLSNILYFLQSSKYAND